MGHFLEFIKEGFVTARSELANKLKEKYKDRDVYVHFTYWDPVYSFQRPKAPAMPFLITKKNTDYKDPQGIYAFSKDYLLKNDETPTGFTMAYYAYIIEPTSSAKFLKLNSLTQAEIEKLLKKINVPKDIIERFGHLDPYIFWQILVDYSFKEVSKTYDNPTRAKQARFFTSIIKKMGYNVIEDTGDGIIFPGEPSQTVFLDPSAYKVVEFVQTNGQRETLNWVKSIIHDIPIKHIHSVKLSGKAKAINVLFKNGFKVHIPSIDNTVYFRAPDGDQKSFSISEMNEEELKLAAKSLYHSAHNYTKYRWEEEKEKVDEYRLEIAHKLCDAFGISKKNLKFVTDRDSYLVRLKNLSKTYFKRSEPNSIVKLIIEFSGEGISIILNKDESRVHVRLDIGLETDKDYFYSKNFPYNFKSLLDNAMDDVIRVIDSGTHEGHKRSEKYTIYTSIAYRSDAESLKQFVIMLKTKIFKIRKS